MSVIPYHPASPPKKVPILCFLFVALTYMCLFGCFVFFPAIAATPLPDARKMGLSGKTFAPHISHKGSLWPITVLMEARDSHQLHAFFPISCVDAGQGSARSVSVVLSLATAVPRVQQSALELASISDHIILPAKDLLWRLYARKPGDYLTLNMMNIVFTVQTTGLH